ncbi:MAG TPA: thioredoxin domain-containing protein, partial [Pseudonocardiaceae bacterium]|nr:thioredoxin domain-containing protein [Pseudonocardiaceae bacterium]
SGRRCGDGEMTVVAVEATEETFDREVGASPVPVVVEFFATWCGSCRRFAPTLEQVAGEYAGRVPVVKVNADENPELVRRYGVSSTPTLVLFSGGERAGTLVGAQSADAVRELLAPVVRDRAAAGPVAVPVAWAPVDACTLPTAEQPLRVAEFESLFATALRTVERLAPTWLRLHLDAGAGVEARTRDLTARESSCCSFFDFQLTTAEGGLTVDVRVPEARIEVLDGLARLAEAAGAAAGSGAIA